MRWVGLTGAAALLAAALWLSPALGVVTSGSMAPYLKTGDGFVALRLRPREGDVVVYRPRVLKADYVVHRVVAVSERGLVTKGDASLQTDQASGEPPVSPDRVVGVVVLRVPALGPAAARLADLRARVLPWGLPRWGVAAAALPVLLAAGGRPSRREVRRLWRVRIGDLARGLGALLGLAALLAALAASRGAVPVEYLATEGPGGVPGHVPVGRPGTVPLAVRNPGFLPVAFAVRGADGAVPEPGQGVVPPRDERQVLLRVPPEPVPGWYRTYVRVYAYPLLAPAPVLHRLAAVHPALGYLAVAALPALAGRVLARWAEAMPPLGRVLGLPRPRR